MYQNNENLVQPFLLLNKVIKYKKYLEFTYKGLIKEINEIELSIDAKINIPPRLRMTTLYAVGSSMSYRVCGTGNKSKAFVGYTTKWGDNAYDFNRIGNLTTDEVIALGDYLGLPY